MDLTAKVTGNILICRVKGELDHHTAEEFRDFVDRGLENNPVKHLILDLTHLSFMDSSGIGVLIGRFKKVNLRGARLRLSMKTNRCPVFSRYRAYTI
jgi:stage II sporulation protein AA (anti-sigma F factor antagonist)